jgi:hypothetical protein
MPEVGVVLVNAVPWPLAMFLRQVGGTQTSLGSLGRGIVRTTLY